MFIYMVAVYGALVTLMGALGNEAELVAVGLLMMFVGNLHRIGKFASRFHRRDI